MKKYIIAFAMIFITIVAKAQFTNFPNYTNSAIITGNVLMNSTIPALSDFQLDQAIVGVVIGDVVAYTIGSIPLPSGVYVKYIQVINTNTIRLVIRNDNAISVTPNSTFYFKKL
jgi:hypothetical protein